uniref:Uncharacterized protein n=1 Tax=Vespula pensylvanica TaxID=30213 RepID=A0A834U7R7_VESPE|nr:hypothetical protein H0235_010498 [Vespula pensylvanica]
MRTNDYVESAPTDSQGDLFLKLLRNESSSWMNETFRIVEITQYLLEKYSTILIRLPCFFGKGNIERRYDKIEYNGKAIRRSQKLCKHRSEKTLGDAVRDFVPRPTSKSATIFQNDPLATKSNYRSITGRKRRRAIAIIHLPVNCDCDCYVPAITMRLDVPIKKVAHVPETH